MDYHKACLYAKELLVYFANRLSSKNEYLHNRTCCLFYTIVFDEIKLYYYSRNQSSLQSNTEFGISSMISEVFINFIHPLYQTLFMHSDTTYKSSDITTPRHSHTCIQPKKAVFNLKRNTIHCIEKI